MTSDNYYLRRQVTFNDSFGGSKSSYQYSKPGGLSPVSSVDLNKNYQKSSWQQQPSSYSNTSYKTSYSSSSKFEDRLPMASNTYIHSSYPLSRSYSEANKIRYESPAPLSTRYISPAPGSVRYNNIVPMYTAPVRYTSPAPVPIRYASPAPVSSRYTSPAPASLTRYSSPAPGLSQLSARRLSDMRPPPPKPRDLPPAPPRPVRRHYPLPPPSFTDAMVAVSKRLRNRSASPVPRYADLQISRRPSLINAALGRETPSREVLRRNLVGSTSSSYIYSSSRHL